MERQFEALSATGVPAYGAACPVTGYEYLKVVDQDVVMLDALMAKVTSVYRKPTAQEQPDPANDTGATVKTIRVSLTSVRTNKDRNGDLMVVTHNGIQQVAEMDVQRPVVVLTYERRENARPLTRAITLVGTTNNATFEGCSAGTVMFTNLEASTKDGGTTYDVRYEFTYNPYGWAPVAYWIDPDTGRPPADLVDGVGIIEYEQYDPGNHAGMSLT